MKKIAYLDLIRESPSVEEISQSPRKPIRVILDNIRSLYNVGSIFRTSDAAGIEKLYLCGITGTPPRAEIHKAALAHPPTLFPNYQSIVFEWQSFFKVPVQKL